MKYIYFKLIPSLTVEILKIQGQIKLNFYLLFSFSFPSLLIYQHLKEREKMRLKINDSEIVWPGKIKKKPEGFFIPTHLKVLTIEEKPFVYVRKLTEEEIECEEDEIPCPHFNVTNGNGEKSLNNHFELE
jgi:hypothetical protein